MDYEIESEAAMKLFGEKLGATLNGGVVIELIGDVGAGKTTMVKGLAHSLAISEDVQSPSFTISRVYEARDGLELRHYDFYRLIEPGVMRLELAEAIANKRAIVIIEWAGIVEDVLPADRLTISFRSPSEVTRQLHIDAGGPISNRYLVALA